MAPVEPVFSSHINTLISVNEEDIESRVQEEASMENPPKDPSNGESNAKAMKVAPTTHAENNVVSMAENGALKGTVGHKPGTPTEIHVEGIIEAANDGTTADSTTVDSKERTEENTLSFVFSKSGGRIEAVRRPADQFLDARQRKILENIRHRQKLLSWVRESRLAAEKTIELTVKGEKDNFIYSFLENEPQVSKGDVKEELGGSSEVEDFRKISTMASSSIFLKKLKSGISSTENSATRELRKGANIGKRMSAAVSTLNNSGDWVSSDSSSSQAIAGGQRDASVVSSALVPSQNLVADSSTMIAPILTTNSSRIPTPGKAIEKYSVLLHEQPKNADDIVSQTSFQKTEKMQKKTRKRSSNLKKLSISGVDLQGGISTNTIDHGAPIGIGKFGAMKSSLPPQVASPMTLSSDYLEIIDKRESIAMKLNNLLIKRQNNFLENVSDDSSKQSKNGGCMLHAKSKVSNCAPNTLGRFVTQSSTRLKPVIKYEPSMVKEACLLPRRRKTHWDFVLEEMRWIATDFIEERKWKLAFGKSLSESLKNQFAETELAKKSQNKVTTGSKSLNHYKISSGHSNGSKKFLPGKEEAAVDVSGLNDPICSFSGDSDPMFIDPSDDDRNFTRDISRLLSISVSEHWGMALHEHEFRSSDHSLALGHRRLQILHDRIRGMDHYDYSYDCANSSCAMDIDTLSQDESSASDNGSLLVSVEHPTNVAKIAELDYAEISQEMQSSVDLVESLKAKTLKSLEKECSLEKYRTTFDCGVKLGRIQLKMIHLIENIWKANANMSSLNSDSATSNRSRETSVAATLGGAVSLGKTVAVSSLVWKNRKTGPQLILCSPCMVVSLLRSISS